MRRFPKARKKPRIGVLLCSRSLSETVQLQLGAPIGTFIFGLKKAVSRKRRRKCWRRGSDATSRLPSHGPRPSEAMKLRGRHVSAQVVHLRMLKAKTTAASWRPPQKPLSTGLRMARCIRTLSGSRVGGLSPADGRHAFGRSRGYDRQSENAGGCLCSQAR
jgi:hypothetical protein